MRDRPVTGSASSAAYGRKMRVAAGADGTWWAAADAPREGDYHCPSCGAELVLRSGPVLASHYAHRRQRCAVAQLRLFEPQLPLPTRRASPRRPVPLRWWQAELPLRVHRPPAPPGGRKVRRVRVRAAAAPPPSAWWRRLARRLLHASTRPG